MAEMTVNDALAAAETVQTNLDLTWILLAGFLVFFMQAGFAMLEGGMIRETGVVNSLAENFMDACVTVSFSSSWDTASPTAPTTPGWRAAG